MVTCLHLYLGKDKIHISSLLDMHIGMQEPYMAAGHVCIEAILLICHCLFYVYVNII